MTERHLHEVGAHPAAEGKAELAATTLIAKWDNHIPQRYETLHTMIAAAYNQGALDAMTWALGDGAA